MPTQRPHQSIGGPLPVQASVREPEDAEMGEDLEEIESEVKLMAEKILHYRNTLPEQLKNAFALLASAHRPGFPQVEHGSEPGPSGTPHQGSARLVPISRVSPLLSNFAILLLAPAEFVGRHRASVRTVA